MAEFTSYEPQTVEVLGEVIVSFLQAFPEELRGAGATALANYGIRELDTKKFYSAQPFLNAMKDIAERFGRNWMTRIGERIALRVTLPAHWKTFRDALEGLDIAYHSKYRGGNIGNWNYYSEGEDGGLTHVRMVSTNHYCCAFDRGVLEGFAERFRSTGVIGAVVRHDDSQPCRKNGADSCSYIISWG